MQLLRQGGDPFVKNAARDNVVIPAQVGVAVERKPVRGNAASYLNACRGIVKHSHAVPCPPARFLLTYGTNFCVADPDAGVGGALCLELEASARGDEQALDLVHIAAHSLDTAW